MIFTFIDVNFALCTIKAWSKNSNSFSWSSLNIITIKYGWNFHLENRFWFDANQHGKQVHTICSGVKKNINKHTSTISLSKLIWTDIYIMQWNFNLIGSLEFAVHLKFSYLACKHIWMFRDHQDNFHHFGMDGSHIRSHSFHIVVQ